MKHLLNGVAMAAVLALATPAFAQNAPMTPSTPPTAAPAPAPKTVTSTAPTKPMAKRPIRHVASTKHTMSQGDQMTDQLNQQELARIQGGSTPTPPAAPMPGQQMPSPGIAAPPPPATH
jgi:hypothetical protein